MVRNFMEDGPEKQRCGRNWCNCASGDCTDDSSDDEFDACSCFGDLNLSSFGEACENVKSLVPCVSVLERNLLADTSRIVDQNKISKRKDDAFLKIVIDGLSALGYNASICNSHWGKSSSCPAGEYKYVDVVTEGERLIIDIDFRSEFEIARPTKKYRTILQTLPAIFVGKGDRLQKIISIVTEAAKQSLKKKGMPFPPWRKAEYVKSKWLSSYCRTTPTIKEAQELPNSINNTSGETKIELEDQFMISEKCSELKPQLTFGGKSSPILLYDKVKSDLEPQLTIGKKSAPMVFEDEGKGGLEHKLTFCEKSSPDGVNGGGSLTNKSSSSVFEDRVNGGCSLAKKSHPIVFGDKGEGGSLNNNFEKNEKTLVEAQIEQQKIKLKKSSGAKISGGLACIIED
ncbi:hypothetical protein Leryth_018629 [Lithospermum erythrorhizon]|nr:hypothetical protein Leryth_018629 [Lithospermum erythrorhizon]